MKRLSFVLALLALAGWAAGCKSKPPVKRFYTEQPASFVTVTNEGRAALPQPSNQLFTLGPGDRIDIEILGQPQSRLTTAVGPDGKIYYHLLPGTDVWGLTLTETSQAIQKGLVQYLTDPQVSVTLREVRSRHVWLLGRMNKPGIYPMPAPITLLEAISLAGGTARSASPSSSEELADLRHSFVMRKGQLLPVDFQRLLKEGDTTQNLTLEPDDFVYIPSALSQEVFVIGAVKVPRAIPYTETLTLVSALTGAEGPIRFDYFDRSDYGWQQDARLSHITVVRGSLVEPQVAVVDFGEIMKGRAPNMKLEPGDIVFVPNSPLRFLKSYVNTIVNTFVGTVAANEGIRAAGGNVGVTVSIPVSP